MNFEEKRTAIKERLMKYLLPDCLKPQYDGMSLYEISGLLLQAIGEMKVQNPDEPADERRGEE